MNIRVQRDVPNLADLDGGVFRIVKEDEMGRIHAHE